MSSLIEKIEAIEKIGVGEQLNHTLRKWIHLQVQKYAKQMVEIQKELALFEKKFGMTSEDGRLQYEAGILGDDADVMEWMGLYDNMCLYQERQRTLRAVIEND